jgi:hypothetical protein
VSPGPRPYSEWLEDFEAQERSKRSRACEVCGTVFIPAGRARTCTPPCAHELGRRNSRDARERRDRELRQRRADAAAKRRDTTR